VDQILDSSRLLLRKFVASEGSNLFEGIEQVAPVVGQATRRRPAREDCTQGTKAPPVTPSADQSSDVVDDLRRSHGTSLRCEESEGAACGLPTTGKATQIASSPRWIPSSSVWSSGYPPPIARGPRLLACPVVDDRPKLLGRAVIRERRAEAYRDPISVLAPIAHRALIVDRCVYNPRYHAVTTTRVAQRVEPLPPAGSEKTLACTRDLTQVRDLTLFAV
jgi:hypothetical protein